MLLLAALPLPSAKASEKLAKRIVSQSHIEIVAIKLMLASPCPNKACTHNAVVIVLPISTTNMTGLRIIQRGFSFKKDSIMARRYNSQLICGCCFNFTVVLLASNLCLLTLCESFIGFYLINNCSTIGPRDKAGMKLSAPTIITTAISQKINSGV